jgi:hypothetical protein
VVLLSAGIGATPVLAMLYGLAAVRSTRPVLWLYAARDRQHHPFAAEVRRLMLALAHGRAYVCYSRPGCEDFDATGHLSRTVFDEVGIPREADVYLCGPTRFMAEMKEALAAAGVALERIHVEIFNGSESMTPGVVGAATRAPHVPRTTPTPVRWYRSREVASPHTGRRRPTKAFWSWPRRATFRSAGRAGRVFVTAVRAVWFRVRSPIDPSHSRRPPTATFSFAAHNLFVTASLIYEL